MQLIERLRAHGRSRPDAPAYVDSETGDALTWVRLANRVETLAETIRRWTPANTAALICIDNRFELPVAILATLAADRTAFPVSMDTPAAQIEALARQTGSNTLIEVDGLKPLPSVPTREVPAGLMLLSSGTTASPKIVCRSPNSLDIVSDQMCRAIGITAADRVLATVPLCHSYGIEHGLLAPVWAGATVHLSRGLDLQRVQRELLQSRITVLPAVPAMYEMLANLLTEGEHFPSLRAAYSAGAPLPTTVADRFFKRCGIRIGQVFGATEIGSVTYSDPAHPHFNPASVGQPMPGVKLQIVDEHLRVCAGSIFDGYLHETESPITDGFYATGDLATLDAHGNVIITGRSKLLIDIGGLKVNPLEVEAVLMQHPAVRECVVMAVQQSETVMRLKAVLTLRDDQQVSQDELRQFARARLASYKVPRVFEIRDQLPHGPSGKVLRREI
jgi:acyl-CoA synthetase (AMP-forming)/AMP-acid ligase II